MVHFLYYLKHALFGLCNEEILDLFFYNLIVWYYTIFTKHKKGIANRKRNRKIIVSLTNVPNRIESVWVTIESLLRQSYKPDEIILWIAQEEFQGVDIPSRLQEQTKRGLSIKYCKKY